MSSSREMIAAATVVFLLPACSSGPPPGFAPDPGLVSHMESIELVAAQPEVCPGERVDMRYFALMDDGSRIPFETRYDEDNPPALHVVMLGRSSREALPDGNGSWRTDDDPLLSAMNGFSLSAFLKVDPTVRGTATVTPEYSCVRHSFAFSGQGGSRGQAGRNGPDVDVQLRVLSSPYVDRLLVAGIAVESAPPFYVLFDADRVSTADWIVARSSGGRGGRGVRGEPGVKGAVGATACPGGRGAPGGPGGVGGPGGTGGRGGRVIVHVSEEDPYLAGMVEAVVPGGRGGAGGPGGPGGKGGDGGPGQRGERRCAAGEAGPDGPAGSEGRAGRNGRRGPGLEVVEVAPQDVFGRRIPAELADLIAYHDERGGR